MKDTGGNKDRGGKLEKLLILFSEHHRTPGFGYSNILCQNISPTALMLFCLVY